MIQFVSVVNNYSLYNDTIGANPYMNVHQLHTYDNTKLNIGIARRYNDFIRTRLQSNGWVVFCHQDFSMQEDITSKLSELDPNFIYGPTGTGPTKQLVFIASISRFGIERFRIGLYERTKKFGQILQSTPRRTQRTGKWLRQPKIVDTVDCCCMIIHASLIQKHALVFDEKLDWHLYVEDFCLNARHHHGVLTKAIQLDCVHLSAGTADQNFEDALHYMKRKYGAVRFSTTCYDGYSRF